MQYNRASYFDAEHKFITLSVSGSQLFLEGVKLDERAIICKQIFRNKFKWRVRQIVTFFAHDMFI